MDPEKTDRSNQRIDAVVAFTVAVPVELIPGGVLDRELDVIAGKIQQTIAWLSCDRQMQGRPVRALGDA